MNLSQTTYFVTKLLLLIYITLFKAFLYLKNVYLFNSSLHLRYKVPII